MIVKKSDYYTDIFPFIDDEKDVSGCMAYIAVHDNGQITYQDKYWTADDINRLHSAFLHALKLQAECEEKS